MTQAIKLNITDRKVAAVLTMLVSALVVLTLTQDILRSNLKNSGFFFSESFMFSSFWWLFVPLLFTQYAFVKYTKTKSRRLFQPVLIFLPAIIHLFAFPALVWAISKAFYYHNFAFQQTFRYALSEHVYPLILFYTIPVLSFQYFTRKTTLAETIPRASGEPVTDKFTTTILVSEGNKKQVVIVSDILFFSANPPYINLHLEGKKYLHNETLRSISVKLNPEQFVRVHRSAIVNIKMVVSYATRLNGDYDLTLKNNTQIRLSRNFAAGFKDLFHKTHRLATK